MAGQDHYPFNASAFESFMNDVVVSSDLEKASANFETAVPSERRFEVALTRFLPLLQNPEEAVQASSEKALIQQAAAAYLLSYLYRCFPAILNPFQPVITAWIQQALRHNASSNIFVQQVARLQSSQHSQAVAAPVSGVELRTTFVRGGSNADLLTLDQRGKWRCCVSILAAVSGRAKRLLDAVHS